MTSADLPQNGWRALMRPVSINAGALIALPALLYMALVYAFPLILLLASSIYTDDGFSFRGYVSILSDAYYRGVIWNSLKLGLVTTAISLVIGYPAAYALARARGGLQVVLFALVFLPLTVSIIVKSFGLSILMRRDGLINWFLLNLNIVDQPVRLVFTEFSLFMGMVNVFLPFMILPLYSVMRMVDTRLLDAAASLGATPLYRFTHVLMPLTMPGVVAGISLVFSLSVAAYVTPSLLIGDSYMTMSMVMAKAYLNLRDFQLGSSMGALLLFIAVVVVVGASLLTRNMQKTGR